MFTLNKTSNEFNLTECTLEIKNLYLVINMVKLKIITQTYKVIDDQRGANGNRHGYDFYYGTTRTFHEQKRIP